jgi:hypothetical protein
MDALSKEQESNCVQKVLERTLNEIPNATITLCDYCKGMPQVTLLSGYCSECLNFGIVISVFTTSDENQLAKIMKECGVEEYVADAIERTEKRQQLVMNAAISPIEYLEWVDPTPIKGHVKEKIPSIVCDEKQTVVYKIKQKMRQRKNESSW